jgi:hypothetical protein
MNPQGTWKGLRGVASATRRKVSLFSSVLGVLGGEPCAARHGHGSMSGLLAARLLRTLVRVPGDVRGLAFIAAAGASGAGTAGDSARFEVRHGLACKRSREDLTATSTGRYDRPHDVAAPDQSLTKPGGRDENRWT